VCDIWLLFFVLLFSCTQEIAGWLKAELSRYLLTNCASGQGQP